MTTYQGVRLKKWMSVQLVFVAVAFAGGGAYAQLKDCFDVHEEARQSRQATLLACCRGTFDKDKKNSKGWTWHSELNLYIDLSKCDRAELRSILIEKLEEGKLEKEKPASQGSGKPSSGIAKTKKSATRNVDVATRIEVKNQKIIKKSGNFSGANLAGLVYTYGNADEANFEGADLRNANFEGTNLIGANFRNARLDNAKFDHAYLKDAVFTNAVLTGASLKGAVLRGANFLGARVVAAQLSVAFWAGAIVDATLQLNLERLDKAIDAVIKDTDAVIKGKKK